MPRLNSLILRERPSDTNSNKNPLLRSSLENALSSLPAFCLVLLFIPRPLPYFFPTPLSTLLFTRPFPPPPIFPYPQPPLTPQTTIFSLFICPAIPATLLFPSFFALVLTACSTIIRFPRCRTVPLFLHPSFSTSWLFSTPAFLFSLLFSPPVFFHGRLFFPPPQLVRISSGRYVSFQNGWGLSSPPWEPILSLFSGNPKSNWSYSGVGYSFGRPNMVG